MEVFRSPVGDVLFAFVIFVCPSFTFAMFANLAKLALKGNPIEREIKLGQTQSFGVTLDRDQFLKLILSKEESTL